MKKILFLFLLFLSTIVNAQIKSYVSVFGGVGVLTHKANLETTNYYPLYKSISIFVPDTEEYTFEKFKEVYRINTNVYQPRAGAKIFVKPENLPFSVNVEIATSPSTITAPRVGVELGLFDKFYIEDDLFINFFCGYKFVKDWGWGTQTLINSMHNRKAKNLLREWFVANDLGINYGHILRVNSGINYTFIRNCAVQLEGIWEIDVSAYKTKPARMTNFAINVGLVYKIIN